MLSEWGPASVSDFSPPPFKDERMFGWVQRVPDSIRPSILKRQEAILAQVFQPGQSIVSEPVLNTSGGGLKNSPLVHVSLIVGLATQSLLCAIEINRASSREYF